MKLWEGAPFMWNKFSGKEKRRQISSTFSFFPPPLPRPTPPPPPPEKIMAIPVSCSGRYWPEGYKFLKRQETVWGPSQETFLDNLIYALQLSSWFTSFSNQV